MRKRQGVEEAVSRELCLERSMKLSHGTARLITSADDIDECYTNECSSGQRESVGI